MKKQEVVALLPMKSHSERVPNKNIRLFNGKPLYKWVLNSLLNSKYISQIIVNTDSEYILSEISSLPKVKAVNRLDELRGDYVAMNRIIAHDISLTENEYFLQTHATNPLISTKTIDDAIDTYFKNICKYDSLFSVIKYHSRFYKQNGCPINHNLNKMIRSQDSEAVFEENSNIFIFSKASFMETNSRIGQNPFMFEMNKFESIDIDEEEDFSFAEILYKHKHIN